ncbi:MAG TPA: hypothetical protein VF271_09715 [Rhodanobacteraceae bacterium]
MLTKRFHVATVWLAFAAMALLALMPTAGRIAAGLSSGAYGCFMDMPAALDGPSMATASMSPAAMPHAMAHAGMTTDGTHEHMPANTCPYCPLLMALAKLALLAVIVAATCVACRQTDRFHLHDLPASVCPCGLGACGPPRLF